MVVGWVVYVDGVVLGVLCVVVCVGRGGVMWVCLSWLWGGRWGVFVGVRWLGWGRWWDGVDSKSLV